MSSKRITLIGGAVLVGVLLIALMAGTVLAQRPDPWRSRDGYDHGPGMMGGTMGRMGYGPALMSGLAQEPGSANPQDGFDWGDCHSDDMMDDWKPGDMMGGKGYGGMMGGMGPDMMGDWGYADPG